MRWLLNKLLNLSIGSKLSLSFMFIVLLTSLPISAFMVLWSEKALKEHIEDTIRKEIISRENDIRSAILNNDYWSIFKQVEALARLKGVRDTAVVNNLGYVLAHSNPMEYPIGTYLPNYERLEKIPIDSYNYTLAYVVYRIDNEAIEDSLLPLKFISAGLTFPLLFIGISMGFLVSLRISTRLKRVLSMIDNFEKGRLEKVEFLEKDEISTFSDYMYKSLSRINTIIKNSIFERDFYQSLVNSLQDILLILDKDGKIYYANKMIEKLGYVYEKLLGRSVFVLLKEGKDRKRLRTKLKSEEAFIEKVKLRAGSSYIYAIMSFVPTEEAIIVSIKDVTELVRMEENIKRMEVFYMLGEFSAGLAHELKNALVPIKLLSDVQNWDEEDIKVVRHAINRINSLVNATLEFANPGNHPEETVFSKELISSWLSLYEPLIRKKEVRVSTYVDDFSFKINKQAFQIIFCNLFKNALEVVPEGKGWVEVHLRKVNGKVVLIVKDNGPGIPTKYKDKVFEPFFTTKGKSGTGLGLSLVLKYAYEIGGYLRMETKEGVGTKFILEVPLKYGEEDSGN